MNHLIVVGRLSGLQYFFLAAVDSARLSLHRVTTDHCHSRNWNVFLTEKPQIFLMVWNPIDSYRLCATYIVHLSSLESSAASFIRSSDPNPIFCSEPPARFLGLFRRGYGISTTYTCRERINKLKKLNKKKNE